MTRVLCRPLKNDVAIYRGIAQSGSALALGARCREFKSLYPDQFLIVNFENDSWINGDCSSVGRALDCDSGCRGFEPHQSPHFSYRSSGLPQYWIGIRQNLFLIFKLHWVWIEIGRICFNNVRRWADLIRGHGARCAICSFYRSIKIVS